MSQSAHLFAWIYKTGALHGMDRHFTGCAMTAQSWAFHQCAGTGEGLVLSGAERQHLGQPFHLRSAALSSLIDVVPTGTIKIEKHLSALPLIYGGSSMRSQPLLPRWSRVPQRGTQHRALRASQAASPSLSKYGARIERKLGTPMYWSSPPLPSILSGDIALSPTPGFDRLAIRVACPGMLSPHWALAAAE